MNDTFAQNKSRMLPTMKEKKLLAQDAKHTNAFKINRLMNQSMWRYLAKILTINDPNINKMIERPEG